LSSELIQIKSNRQRTMHLVSLLPGIHLRELQRLLGISFSSTRYNVERLCNSGEITSQRENGYIRLYPTGTKNDERIVFSLLRSKTTSTILAEVVKEHEGITHKQLCERTGFAKSTVTENLRRVVESGLVEIKFSADLKQIYVSQNHNELLRMLISSRRLSDRGSATERFIDLWDF
jgi:predicted transcriptional regulator